MSLAERPDALRGRLDEYLTERGGILMVTGPSKAGKSVLVRQAIPEGLWLSGAQLDSTDRFWQAVVDRKGGCRRRVKTGPPAPGEIWTI
ncbi:MAG: hypothetical protein ACRD1T_13075 [Acidimicrobiia bacterium]